MSTTTPRPMARTLSAGLTFGYAFGFAFLSLALAACNSATITGVSFSADTNAQNIYGTITVNGTSYKVSPGEANSFSFDPVKTDHIDVKLLYTERRNESQGEPVRVAAITSKIGMDQAKDQSVSGKASGGTVSINIDSSEMPGLVANCDNLFSVSSQPAGTGTLVNIEFNGFTSLSACQPVKKVNMALYNPLLIGKRDVSEGLAIYTEEQDEERGKAFLDEFLAENSYLIHDRTDDISQYVQNIAEKVVAASDKPDQKVTAYVIDMDDINAFAIPGGYIFVNTGLITAAQSEAEIVGVLGHEWSHVTCRHASRARSVFRILLGKDKADQREYEYEADAIGTQYAWNAGYEPYALTSLFKQIMADDPTDGDPKAEKKSDHPSTYKRVDRINTYAQVFYPGKDGYIHSTPEFDAANAALKQKQQDPAAILQILLGQINGGGGETLVGNTRKSAAESYRNRVEELYQRHFSQR